MDDALIKPQKVRRVAWVRSPKTDGDGDGEAVAAADTTVHGTLVEVADPRSLRPRDFRLDFVYGSQSSLEDVAQVDLPPLLESVLAGTDATLLVMGADGAGQAELIDGPGGDGRGGVGAVAIGRIVTELQERQSRHRQGGSSGYAYQATLRYCQVTGERVDDLLTDRLEPSRVVDTEDGVSVEGLRSIPVVGPQDAETTIEAAQRRRNATLRGRSSSVLVLEVTQADYWAGWGLFGRLTILECPALDGIAEDRGIVQLREGYDTYRGLFHLRSLVHTWQPRKPIDVAATTLTAVLRDALCGGNVSLTVLLCIQQGQPVVSRSALEFLDDFSKVETNPVTCDHRVAGYARAMRAERLMRSQIVDAAMVGRDKDANERQIILELERKLHAAERNREDTLRAEEFRDSRSRELQDKLITAVRGQESLHERLTMSEEEHLEVCRGIVELQLSNVEVRDEMSENRYKDNVMLVLLEQEVADHQLSARERQDKNRELESGLDHSESECSALHHKVAELQSEVVEEAMATESLHAESSRRAQEDSQKHAHIVADLERKLHVDTVEPLREVRVLRRLAAELEEQLKLAREAAVSSAKARDAADQRLVRATEEFQRDLSKLAAGGSSASPASPDGTSAEEPGRQDVIAGVMDELLMERRRLEESLRAMQEQLVEVGKIGMAWAPDDGDEQEKARVQDAVKNAAARAAEALGSDSTEARRGEEIASLAAELDRERQRASAERVHHSQELKRLDAERAKLEAELMAARSGTDASQPRVTQIQQQLLSEIEALRKQSSGIGHDGAGPSQAELLEKNRALQTRLDMLENKAPAEERARMQRLAFLEKSVPNLEAERSELLVRATVAEEQLQQLQRHLKELTESYQMQIVNLKLQGRSV